MNKYIELGRKLNELAKNGLGGEKINAKNMLDALMKKHNISIEQIEGEDIEEYYFNITKKQFALWHQIICLVNYDTKIYGSFPQKMIKEYGLKGNYMIKATACEYVEIKAKHDFYSRLLDEEYDVFYTAFLQANNLLVENLDKEGNKPTNEEIEKQLRIRELANGIKKGEYLRALSD